MLLAHLMPQLYLNGLSEGDFDLALRDCSGRRRRYLRARSPGSRRGGTLTLPRGVRDLWRTSRWSTCGLKGYM